MTGLLVRLPLRIVSEQNRREHWAAKAKRAAEHRAIARMMLLGRFVREGRPRPPLVVTLTRVGSRTLDTDNLASACKHVRDGIADALGIDDGDTARLVFRYAQRRGTRRTNEVECLIERAGGS